jgi:hypothetical protein
MISCVGWITSIQYTCLQSVADFLKQIAIIMDRWILNMHHYCAILLTHSYLILIRSLLILSHWMNSNEMNSNYWTFILWKAECDLFLLFHKMATFYISIFLFSFLSYLSASTLSSFLPSSLSSKEVERGGYENEWSRVVTRRTRLNMDRIGVMQLSIHTFPIYSR